MKVRKGFVSNSSSSSFVCDVCGTVDSGYDCSPGDLGFAECSNGHIICEGHAINYGFEDYKKYITEAVKNENASRKERNKKWGSKYENINLNKLKGMESVEEIKDSLEEHNYECINYYPACACPICSYSIIPSEQILTYLYRTYKDHNSIIEEIKNKFKTREEFVNFLRGKSK